MMLSPIMNRPTKLDVQFSPAHRWTVTVPLPFQGVSSQDAPFCFSLCMVAQAIPGEGTVQEHLGQCPGWHETIFSVLHYVLIYAILCVFNTYKSICKNYVISTHADEWLPITQQCLKSNQEQGPIMTVAVAKRKCAWKSFLKTKHMRRRQTLKWLKALWSRVKLRWREHRVKSQEPTSSGKDGPGRTIGNFLNSPRALF